MGRIQICTLVLRVNWGAFGVCFVGTFAQQLVGSDGAGIVLFECYNCLPGHGLCNRVSSAIEQFPSTVPLGGGLFDCTQCLWRLLTLVARWVLFTLGFPWCVYVCSTYCDCGKECDRFCQTVEYLLRAYGVGLIFLCSYVVGTIIVC